MRKLTPIEKRAAAAVFGMTVAVVGTGVSLLKKHTRLLVKEAAARFEVKGEEPTEENAASGEVPTEENAASEEAPAGEESHE